MRKRIPRTRIPIVFLENTTIAQFLRLYPYLKGRKNELEQLKSQQKKHSPNTGEKKSIFNMKCEHTDCSVCKSSPMLCSAHQHKDLNALYEGKETKPSKKSIHKLSGCKCLAGVPLKYCLGYKKPEHATLDNPCACKCHRNGDEDPCEKCEPSQQGCFCDCHEGEKIWGKEHSSVESCCNCQPPKSSEWEKKIDKYIKGRHYTSRVYGDNEFNKVIAVSLKRRALQDIKLIMRQALYQQQKKVEERVMKETIDKAFDWIWEGWNLDLANKDRAKVQFLTSIEEKGGKQ